MTEVQSPYIATTSTGSSTLELEIIVCIMTKPKPIFLTTTSRRQARNPRNIMLAHNPQQHRNHHIHKHVSQCSFRCRPPKAENSQIRVLLERVTTCWLKGCSRIPIATRRRYQFPSSKFTLRDRADDMLHCRRRLGLTPLPHLLIPIDFNLKRPTHALLEHRDLLERRREVCE